MEKIQGSIHDSIDYKPIEFKRYRTLQLKLEESRKLYQQSKLVLHKLNECLENVHSENTKINVMKARDYAIIDKNKADNRLSQDLKEYHSHIEKNGGIPKFSISEEEFKKAVKPLGGEFVDSNNDKYYFKKVRLLVFEIDDNDNRIIFDILEFTNPANDESSVFTKRGKYKKWMDRNIYHLSRSMKDLRWSWSLEGVKQLMDD